MAAATHKIEFVWSHLSVTVVLYFGDDTNKNHYGAKFSTPVPVLHQLSENSTCICTWAFLDLCQNITFPMP
jgi:hypothetical protein